MGIELLLVVCFVSALLIMATAIAATLRHPIPLQWIVSCAAIAAPFVVWGVVLLITIHFKMVHMLAAKYVIWVACFGGAMVLGLGILIVAARVTYKRLGRRWPVGWLGALTLIALSMTAVLYRRLDNTGRERLETLKSEAQQIAREQAGTRPPDAENAALVYNQAFTLLPDDERWQEEFGVRNIKHPPLDPQDDRVAQFLEEEEATLTLIHRAARMPSCYFPYDYTKLGEPFSIPEREAFHLAANLVVLESKWAVAQSRTADALDSAQTLYLMAKHSARTPMLLGALISFAMHGRAVGEIQHALDGQTPTAEILGRVQLDDDYTPRRMISRAIVMEEADGLALLHNVAMTGLVQSKSFVGKVGIGAVLSLYRVFLLNDDVAAYRRTIQVHQAVAEMPNREASFVWNEFEPNLAEPQVAFEHRLVVAAMMSIESRYRVEALHSAARAGLAVHCYRADTGKLPVSLDALVPKYLPRVPLDPYDDQPLRWKVDGDRWVVYSIGENLKDEGGAPVDYGKRTGDLGFYSHVPQTSEKTEE